MRKVRVQVTQEDVDRGVRDDCYRCPVARAVSRTLGGHPVKVDVDGIRLLWKGSLPLPDSVREFIGDFDVFGRDQVKPFSFILEVPLGWSV